MARQMVFLIDLPKKEPAKQTSTEDFTPFGEDLSFFLRAQGVSETMINTLHKYDFSETERYGFVHTIGGSHTESDLWQRTGYGDFPRARALLLESTVGS